MGKDGNIVAALRVAVRRVAMAVPICLMLALVLGAAALLSRWCQEVRGEGAVTGPSMATAYAGEPSPARRFTASLDYTSIAAPGDGRVASNVTWDDAWFLADPVSYNHELARTSSVLAALAYSESGYYQVGSTQPAYMEDALAALGFQDVSTESYRYRSEVVDEVLNLFTGDSDSVAYAIARKRLHTGEGAAPRDVILVSIRGSYGSEWLSNLDLMPEEGEEAASARQVEAGLAPEDAEAAVKASPASGSSQESPAAGDHRGYSRACAEICGQLERWVSASLEAGSEVSVLLTGHSRGGAIANLVAAELDDAAARSSKSASDRLSALSRVSAVYAYAFASPATTTSASAQDACYGNIFNIVNPSDIMPYLPLRSWGYDRYGRNLYLPTVGSDGFAARHAAMRDAYAETVGAESSYDPRDEQAIGLTLEAVSRQVATARDLMTPAGVAAAVASCATHIDPVRILYGHYPSTYIAWMDVLEADELTGELTGE